MFSGLGWGELNVIKERGYGQGLPAFPSGSSSRLENQHLIGGDRPFRQDLHVARLHAFDEPLRPEPAGL